MFTKILEKVVSLCKRRGFVFPSAEIYGGLNGVYDLGPLGTQLKNNIRALWWKNLKNSHGPVLPFDGALLGAESIWKASGHIDNFSDPLIDCLQCKKRFRADDIDITKNCPHCGNKNWTPVRSFNLMFKTQLGALEGSSSEVYLRPETAQSIFVNFKNIMTSCRARIPFGIAQVGKAFRNEITPKQFLFRMREFEQMEIEWFCTPQAGLETLDFWIQQRTQFYSMLGITPTRIRIREQTPEERAHYAIKTVDIEYEFPFGWKELEGIAYRGDYDLTQHSMHAKKDLAVFDEKTGSSYTPHVVESSVGTDRLLLTVLCDAYCEESIHEETRTVLKLSPRIAPVLAGILPLSKEQESAAYQLYTRLLTVHGDIQYDDSGSIGKRYRRFDEIGTPVCITYDFETAETNTVTVRNRDTLAQERISIDKISEYLTTLQNSSILIS